MANIEGNGAPRGGTIGNIWDVYTDVSNGRTYKCTAVYATTTMKPHVSELFYEWSRIITENSGSGGTAEVTRESIKNALGYIPQEYDQIQYQKYDDKLIHIIDYWEGTAKLINPQSSLVNHTVTVCGKNLFNVNGDVNTDLSTGEERLGYVTVENGVLTTNLCSQEHHPNGQRLYNLKGKTVSFSAVCVSEDLWGYIGIYENGNEEIYVTGKGQLKLEGYICKTDNPIFGLITSGVNGGVKFTNIQVEIGDTVTDYESYFDTTMPIVSGTDTYSLPIYYGQTNIFNDCGSNMTVMINPTINRLLSDNKTSVKRMGSIIQDANEHISTGYMKTYYGVTQNLPEQVYGYDHAFSSEWGVLFFIAENVDRKTGSQIFYPINGPYKGRIFVRSLTNMNSDLPEPGNWSLLANEAEVNAAKEEVLQYVQSIVGPYNITWTDGGYISRYDGSVNAEEGSSYSDFVSVEPGTKLIISNTMTSDNEYNAFYDASNTFLSSFSNVTGVITVPDGAKYFRLSKYSTATITIVPDVINSIIYNPNVPIKISDSNTGTLYELKVIDGTLTIQEVG